MGLFWESKKEKEARENRALESILHSFEADMKPEPESQRSEPSDRPVSLETLVDFLVSKKIMTQEEWEAFLRENSDKTHSGC